MAIITLPVYSHLPPKAVHSEVKGFCRPDHYSIEDRGSFFLCELVFEQVKHRKPVKAIFSIHFCDKTLCTASVTLLEWA